MQEIYTQDNAQDVMLYILECLFVYIVLIIILAHNVIQLITLDGTELIVRLHVLIRIKTLLQNNITVFFKFIIFF